MNRLHHDGPLAGRYELLERIAGGGMGEVWRARDLTLERTVAIKTVDLNHPDATLSERFRREAVATSRLSNPHVVQVYDAGTDGHTAFLVMELLRGPSVHQVVHENGPMAIGEGLQIAGDVARGLMAAHAIGVVHRDIKPGNVMYDGDRLKLVDFGIAQLSERMGATLTAPATALGTAAYMSPEQATGSGATQASDWYALGCLLMTVFTGQPPFTGDAVHVATQQVDARPPRLSERRAGIPPALDDLVAALLAKDPAARPSGQQVLDQVLALQHDPTAPTMALAAAPAHPRLAPTPTDPPESGPPSVGTQLAALDDEEPRRKWPFVLAALVVLGLLAAAAYALLGRPASTPPPAATPTQVATSTPPRPTRTPPPATPAPPRPSATPPKSSPARPSATPTPSVAPSATSASPSRRASASRTPVKPTDAVGRAIEQVSNDEAREELQDAWGDPKKKNSKQLAKKLAELQAEGKVTEAEAGIIGDALAGR